MKTIAFWAPSPNLNVMSVERAEPGWLVAVDSRDQAACPICGICGTKSNSRHSSYLRTLRDLSAQGAPVHVHARLTRWRCRDLPSAASAGGMRSLKRCITMTVCQRLSASGFPNRIQIRELIVTIKADLVDERGLQMDRPELYRDADYSASQAFASEIRWPKSPPPENGVVFDSVRRKSGTNVCIFWPSKVPLPAADAAAPCP
jgi:hypothetical protein